MDVIGQSYQHSWCSKDWESVFDKLYCTSREAMGNKTKNVPWNQVMKWEIGSNAGKWMVLNYHAFHLSHKIYSWFTKHIEGNRVLQDH